MCSVMDLISVIILVNLIVSSFFIRPIGRYNWMISIMERPQGSFDTDEKERNMHELSLCLSNSDCAIQ